MKSFGPDGQFIIMPGLGISRTEYLKNNQNGRGGHGLFRRTEWNLATTPMVKLSNFRQFLAMNTNGKGEELLGKSSKFQAWDIGCIPNRKSYL